MAKSKKKKPSRVLPIAFALAGVGMLIGLAVYAKSGVANRIPADMARGSVSRQAETTTKEQREQAHSQVTVLKPKYKGEEITYTQEVVDNPPQADPVRTAVNLYLDGVPAVPKAARVTSCDVRGGVAYLNFTKEFDRTYGADDETTIISGIEKTLTQFSEIDLVQFQVDGKNLETLGNSDLSTPQPVKEGGRAKP